MADANEEKLAALRDALSSGEQVESGRGSREAILSLIIYILTFLGIMLAGHFIPVIGIPLFLSISANIGFVATIAQVINVKKGK